MNFDQSQISQTAESNAAFDQSSTFAQLLTNNQVLSFPAPSTQNVQDPSAQTFQDIETLTSQNATPEPSLQAESKLISQPDFLSETATRKQPLRAVNDDSESLKPTPPLDTWRALLYEKARKLLKALMSNPDDENAKNNLETINHIIEKKNEENEASTTAQRRQFIIDYV